MHDLLLRPQTPDADGLVQRVTPESAGWGHVGFELYRLKEGQTLSRSTGDREACLVFVGGRGAVQAGDQAWPQVGDRMDVFEDKLPHSVYVPEGTAWSVEAMTEVILAVCTAPGRGGGLPPRYIGPESVQTETRGTGTNVRHVANILPEWDPADSLLVVEVKTPAGNWSSYPPHKHDQDNLPEESLLEEVYYHRLNPPQGFAFQRVYTDEGDLDETMAVHDGDVVLVPRGYHPVGTAHGYDNYYLNVMAGPKRVWKFNTAEEHRWMLA